MVNLYLDSSDVIHADEHTKYFNCGLPVNFWIFLLKSFCFMMKKDHFKEKLLLWPEVPLKKKRDNLIENAHSYHDLGKRDIYLMNL